MSAASVANDGVTGTPFERHLDGVFVASPTGVILSCNQRLAAWTGYEREALVGQNFHVLFDPAEWTSLDYQVSQAAQGTSGRVSTRCRTKETGEFDVVVTLLASEEPLGVLGIVRDVDVPIATLGAPDPDPASEVVSRQASRLARLLGWSIDVDTGVPTWGEQMYEFFDVEDMSPRDYQTNLMTHYQEPHRTRLRDAIAACVADGTPIDLQIKFHDRTGLELDARVLGRAIRNSAGRVVRVDGAFYDVTGVVRALDEELAGDHRVVEMFNHVTTALFIFDRDWTFHYVNQAGLELGHLQDVNLDTLTLWDLFPEVEFNELGRVYRAAMDEGRFGAATAHMNEFDADFEVVVHPMPDGILVAARNVTEERAAKQEFDKLSERVRAFGQMLDLTKDAVILGTLDHKVTYWNHAAEELYGWTMDEVLASPPFALRHDDPSAVEAALEIVLREGYWSGELVQRSRDGRRIVVESRLSLVRDDLGEPESFFAVYSDVTDERQRQESRIRAQRLESLGTLAGGIAHDLNNALTPLVMSLELLLRRASDERDRRLFESMNSSVTRASQMVRQVLAFARGVEGERVEVPIARLLQQAQEFCRDVLPKSIDLVFDGAGDLGAVIGDETQLMQVLVNLVTNARDAMPDGGVLAIRARNVHARSDDVDGRAAGLWVSITVSDTGEGMDAETQARVFEPFFTTKELSEGTGLGLSTSTAIIKSHGGRLFLESERGRGTMFTVEIPCEPDTRPDETPTLQARQGRLLPERRSRLLIVDDEEAIVTLLRDVLSDAGYEVDAVTSADAALTLLRAGATTYDLILSDVNMPKLDGARFASKARDFGVTTTIAFMSGVSSESVREELGENVTVFYYLQKPFTVSQLLDLVGQAIESTR